MCMQSCDLQQHHIGSSVSDLTRDTVGSTKMSNASYGHGSLHLLTIAIVPDCSFGRQLLWIRPRFQEQGELLTGLFAGRSFSLPVRPTNMDIQFLHILDSSNM